MINFMKKLLSVKTILTVCFFLFAVSLFAQPTDSVKTGNLSFKWNKWRLDGKRVYKDVIKAEMMKVDEASRYYKKGRTNLMIALIAYIPTVAFPILGQRNQKMGSPGFGNERIGFKIAGILSGGLFIYEFTRYSKNSKKAARIYNEY